MSSIYSDGTYLAQHQTWHAEDSPWKADKIAGILSRNGLEPRSIAEIGCGAGGILQELLPHYAESSLVGYEISPQAFAMCQPKAEGRLSFKMADLLTEDAHFDCLLCIDVFEHVPDYLGFLQGLRSKADNFVFHIPLDVSVSSILRGKMMAARQKTGHLHYFTADTALASLKDCGYTVVDHSYTSSLLDWPTRSRKAMVAKPLYRAAFTVAPDLTVKTLGLASLLVLATA